MEIDERPKLTDTQRYPRIIKTISNHLHKKGIENYDLYLVKNALSAKQLKDTYFGIEEYFALNKRGNSMYSRAFDLYIQYLESNATPDTIADDIQTIIEQPNITNTEKTSLIQGRIGQGQFRDSLIEFWGGCSVTGCKHISLLVASHIKPWNVSDNQERLDPYNGLLLLPNIDKVFDQGLISFEPDGKMVISSNLPEYELLGITPEMKISIREKHKPYLEYHRTTVYGNTR